MACSVAYKYDSCHAPASCESFGANLPAAEAYEATDNQYLRHESSGEREDGCTAVTAVVVGQRLLVANVGDSRAVLCRGGKGKTRQRGSLG